MTANDMGELVRKYRKLSGLSQGALAELMTARTGRTFTQDKVSSNERGDAWNEPELAPLYCQVLNIPAPEMTAAQGYPAFEQEAYPTYEDQVRSDPSLDDEAKEHLIRQRRLLQMSTKEARRSKPSPRKTSRRKSG